MVCCDCFGFSKKRHGNQSKPRATVSKHASGEHLLGLQSENHSGNTIINPLRCYLSPFDNYSVSSGSELSPQHKKFEELKGPYNGLYMTCSERTPVKITHHAVRSEDFDGNKVINEYVRECKIGDGSYGKVVLHRSMKDNKLYAIKIFHKSRLRKLRVAPDKTAMMDVLKEVDIMKRLNHPNIVKLIEVIDDPDVDQLYMVLEYVQGGRIFGGHGPCGGIGESTARRYFHDIITGLVYLHNQCIVHGDIKPENLLVTSDGHVKICDFGVSCSFEGNNDMLRRSPGTPVFTAPECCLGMPYNGKAADVWALGVTLYCMVLGCYPFIGETFQQTCDKIVNERLNLPKDMCSDLRDLLEGLLCKDPKQRLTLDAIARHSWVKS